jgi:hypothetical protein
MVSFIVISNFKGTKLQTVLAAAICLMADSIYVIPIVNHYIN